MRFIPTHEPIGSWGVRLFPHHAPQARHQEILDEAGYGAKHDEPAHERNEDQRTHADHCDWSPPWPFHVGDPICDADSYLTASRRIAASRRSEVLLARRRRNMTGETRSMWAAFTRHANWETLHPNDWSRFYAFAVASSDEGLVLSEEDVREALVAVGPMTAKAQEYLPEIYRHCRGVLDHKARLSR